jgi:hypothetical protein
MALGGFGIRAVSGSSSAILANLAMRAFAILFLTLARVAFAGFFRRFLMQHAPYAGIWTEAMLFHIAQSPKMREFLTNWLSRLQVRNVKISDCSLWNRREISMHLAWLGL